MGITTKKLDGKGLEQVWASIVANFAEKGEAGENNIIEKISVNGVQLTVTEKGVNIEVPGGALADLDKVGQAQLEEALLTLINGKANASTTLAGYGIADAYTKTEADSAISTAVGNAIAGVYKVKGSIAFAELPVSDMAVGDVYNVTDDFTTNASFICGAGKTYPAGTNVVYTDNGWDAMAGTYDFSGFLKASDLVDLTEEEIAAICVMPTV